MTYKNFQFTAFCESDLLEGGNTNIGHGDTFTMPGTATVCIDVRDDDSFLSGDYRDQALDHSGQHASITDADGNELGNGGQIYAESYFWVTDSHGKKYLMIEIEPENSSKDYFTFYTGGGYTVPEPGTELHVGARCNVKGNWVDFKCLDAGEKEVKDMWAFDENTCTYTTEAECWDLHDFKVVDGAQASGGKLIKIKANDGRISTDFGGDDGVYNLTICAQDENDGISKLKVYVNGEFQQTIMLDQQSDGGGSNNGGFSEFTLQGLEIKAGDEVEIRAWANGCEFVRIDAIKFEQVKFEVCDDPGAVNIGFDGFSAGDILTNQIDGITISAMGGSDDAMIFDSQNPTGGDGDLETQVAQLGNVLIVSEDGDSSDPDDVVGGKLTFKFDNPATIFDLKVIDTEEGGTITLTLEGGSTETFDIPNLVNGGVGQVVMNVDDVVCMDVELNGSGAIDDLCYVPGAPEPGSLSGRYFCDVDRDDVDDGQATDPGIAGIVVTLLDAAGAPVVDGGGSVVTTTTDAQGEYSFTGLAAGSYGVAFSDPTNVNAGKELVAPNQGSDDSIDSDAIGDATNSSIQGIVVVAGQDTPDNDAGVRDLPGALSGTYFCDDNRNDVDDGADTDVAGKAVMLFEADGVTPAVDIDGAPVASVLTDPSGNYRFDNLAAGSYVVMFESSAAEGKEFVAADQGGDDTIDSDVVDALNGKTAPVEVVAGQETKDVDAGVAKINNPPQPQPDALKLCADETDSLNILANDVDPDGDPLLVDEFIYLGADGMAGGGDDEIIVPGSGPTTIASGAVVTVDALGNLTYDVTGTDSFDALDIGQEAVEKFVYTVSDGQGGSGTSSVDVTVCGNANSVASLGASLPAGNLILQILDETWPNGTFTGGSELPEDPLLPVTPDHEEWTIKISGSGDARFDGAIFDEAYCLEINTPVLAGRGRGQSDIDFAPNETVTMALLDGSFDFGADKGAGLTDAQVANAINWILNQDFNNDPTYSGLFEDGGLSQPVVTDAEIQAAVWGLTDDNLFLPRADLGQSGDAQQIFNLAVSNADFQVGTDDKIGVLLDPVDNGQPFVFAINFEDYDCLC